jgi:membrane-bound lytic murein transglycosylase MltF
MGIAANTIRRTAGILVLTSVFFCPQTWGQSWGQLRTVNVPVTVMAGRDLESSPAGRLTPGEWVKAAFFGGSWAAVFPRDATIRDESHAIGYVRRELLKPYSHYMENVWIPAEENQHDPRVSLSEEFCKLDFSYDEKALLTIVPQLSRLPELATADLPTMVARRTIRVLTTYTPSTYFVANGRSYGFEYSLLKDYEHYLNRGVRPGKLRTVIEFLPVPENLLIPSLVAGIGDIAAAGVRITPERAGQVDFTIPYLSGVSEVLVTHRGAPPVNRLADLAGRAIYLLPGWQSSKTLRRINARLLVNQLPMLRTKISEPFLSSEDLLELVNAGTLDLALTKSHIARLWASKHPNLVILEYPEISEHTPIAWMVRRDNPLLKASLNRFLKGRRHGSRFGNIYYRQYFMEADWVGDPLAPTDRVKFSRYVPLFRKYGARYGFDWMLLAAIAYQESGMDHTRRSPSGAVGLMQVLPSTAHDPNIDIPDVSDPEQNIHAAAKYLALLRDVYFNVPQMPPEERIRFCLAAYNAGPTKIEQCRKAAVRLGLDPNQWFGQTEIAAMHLIGSETVRYVSNVKKYYLAYSLGHTLDCLKRQQIETLKSEKALLPSAGIAAPPTPVAMSH